MESRTRSKSFRTTDRNRGGMNIGPSTLNSELYEDASAVRAALGLDMSLILAPTGGPEKDERRIRSVAFQLNEEGKAVGTPQDVVVFSDQLKRSITKNTKNPIYREIHYQNHPWIIKTDARYLQGRYSGFSPVSSLFHETSHREREGSDDVGVDSEDSESQFLVVKNPKNKKAKHENYNRKSILYESINQIGMVKGNFAFPRRTYMPKTLIPYDVAEDQVPKAIVVERLNRAYRAMDINLVLQSLGIIPSDLIPPACYGETNDKFYHEKMFRNRIKIDGLEKREYIYQKGRIDEHLQKVQMFATTSSRNVSPTKKVPSKTPMKSKEKVTKVKQNSGSDSGSDDTVIGSKSTRQQFFKTRPPFEPMFPLHHFDDEEFDVRIGVEWLALGWDHEEKKNYAVPGKAYLPFPKSSSHKNLPTLATKTNKILLSRTEKLEELRKTLMKARYTRMLANAGLSPSQVESSATKMEIAMLAKVVSTVSSLTHIESHHHNTPSRKSIFLQRFSSIVEAIMDRKSIDSDEDVFTDIEESFAGLQHDLVQLKSEYDKTCYTLDTNEEDDFKRSRMLDGKEESEMGLDRSESLLSEVFSQLESMTLISEEDVIMLKTQDEKTENDVSDTSSTSDIDSDSGDGDGSPHPVLAQVKSIIRRKSSVGAKGARRGTNIAPSSPDVDAYDADNAINTVIFDYDKMKKPFNYDWRWAEVAVIDYDLEAHKYLVCSTTSKVTIFAWIGKPYLCFDGEDPFVQGERIRDAVFKRYEFEYLMRYNLYLDCLPLKNIPVADETEVEKIVNKIHWDFQKKLPTKLLSKVSLEQDLIYQRVHAKLHFEKLHEKMPHAFRPWITRIPNGDFKLDEFNFNTKTDVWESRKERYNLSKRAFSYKVRQLQRKMFLGWPETRLALETVVYCCEEAKKKSFIMVKMDDPVHLDEYDRIQMDHVSALIQYLKNEWYETILSTIRTELTKMNNSSFNLNEQDYQMYNMSRLPAFLRLINYIMEETVKTMLINSFMEYQRHIRDLTVNCKSRKYYDWGNDLTTSKFALPKGLKPLFILELKMERDGPKYTNLLAKYLQIPSRVFTMCIKSVHRFPTLLAILMPNFHGAEKNTLNIMEENDPLVDRLRVQTQHYLKAPLLFLDSFAQKFWKYMTMWNIDDIPHAASRQQSEVRMTTADLRRLLDQDMADIERIENEISEDLVVSAFVANTGLVKHALIKKKTTSCHLRLTNFAEKLKNSVLKISNKYVACERKLGIRSDDIKEVMELKKYAETVPGLIADCVNQMIRIVKDYDVFEEYHHILPDEDVENKWMTAVQSHRMVQIVATAMDLLEDDYERLLKVQQQELVSLSDQIDSATMAVAGLNGHVDLARAQEAALDVKKVWQIIRDLEERVEVLNERQLIFKQPPTQTGSLKRLLHDIEPYKNLWFTAVECLRVKESLMKDSLEKIDVSNLTKSVYDGLKVMDHCIRFFDDTPPIQHIAMEVKHLTTTYQPILPLVEAFKNPAVKSRHWDEISKICGYPVYPKANEPFKRLLDKGILEKADSILEIARTAVKETEIFTAIEVMELHISSYSIRINTDEDTEIQIVQLEEAALETVENCLRDTDALMQSPYKSLYDEKLSIWRKKINAVKENLELWFDMQDEWISMQSHLPVIRTQTRTPNVLKMYKRAVRVWRRLVRLAKEAELMEEAALNLTVNSSLRQFQLLLEKIKQGMEEYANRRSPKGSDSDD